VIATCVFCSVPDPVLGLRELHRVLAPGGQLLLIEHVLSHKPVVHTLMQVLNPVVVRMMGANINRETLTNIHVAGFEDLVVEDLLLDIFKRITARKEVVGLTNTPAHPDAVLVKGGAYP